MGDWADKNEFDVIKIKQNILKIYFILRVKTKLSDFLAVEEGMV